MSHDTIKATARLGAVALAVLCPVVALAENGKPEITLRISATDLEVIAHALDALPLDQTAPTIIRLQEQIDAMPRAEWAKYQSATTVETVGRGK